MAGKLIESNRTEDSKKLARRAMYQWATEKNEVMYQETITLEISTTISGIA